MNDSMEQTECIIEMVGTPNRKKLKQARLPFQALRSSESADAAPSKKRKFSALSPTHCSGEKIAKKEYMFEKHDEIAITQKHDEDEIQEVEDVSLEVSTKSDGTMLVKPNALTRFLQKVAVSTVDTNPHEFDPTAPGIIFDSSDVDTTKGENELIINDSLNHSIVSNVNQIGESKNGKSNDLSLDSVKEVDIARGTTIMTCRDELVANSGSESDSPSSEEDNDYEDDEGDGDDDKRSEDDMDYTHQGHDDNSEPIPTRNKIERKTHVKQRKLTPKQLEKRMEMVKKQEARQKLRDEREKQRIERRIKRRHEKEAEKEQKRKEREQRELKKQIENEQKQREKERKEKAKEEDRRKREEAKEEEKRRKEEEKLELERKKQKAASTFVSFFVPKKPEAKSSVEEKIIGACNFMPFEIKVDMKVAPTCRRTLNNAAKLKLDLACFNSIIPPEQLYLDEIKSETKIIRKPEKTWIATAENDVVLLEDDELDSTNVIDQATAVREKHRPKLLHFAENRRPPYWGTWRKKSNIINCRRPFAKDTKWFDYEIDSDEEWEEEEPGESLRGSDDEKDEENPDDDEYDVDNEFMVPHGYLSDEEARGDGEDEENTSPEIQKFKLKILGEQFEAEMNEKTAKIRPKVIGCVWQGPLSTYPGNTSSNVIELLKARQVWVTDIPIILASTVATEVMKYPDTPTIPKKQSTPGTKKTKVPEEALSELIRLVHGNPHGRTFLIKEFITYWHSKYPDDRQRLSKISIAHKIQELAKRIPCPEEGPMLMKSCWYVPEEIRKKYLTDELTLPNKWHYVLTPKMKMANEVTDIVEKTEAGKELNDRDKEKEHKDKDREKKIVPLITQFTKKITQEEMKKQLSMKSSPKLLPSTLPNKPPKRITPISVARGEEFPKASIINSFSKISQSSKCENMEHSPGISDIAVVMIDDSLQRIAELDESESVHHAGDDRRA